MQADCCIEVDGNAYSCFRVVQKRELEAVLSDELDPEALDAELSLAPEAEDQ